ncbi:MAG: DinB family protein [Planctomycetes bacterium]|nr:DinB family protein [Planctomycetota bacterium]
MPYAAIALDRPMPTVAELARHFASLADMPAELERALARVAPKRRTLRPAEGSFSLHEHVWHLRDIEVLGYRERLRALLVDDAPFLADLDGTRLAVAGDYHARSLEEGLAEFRRVRAENVARLRALPHAAFARRGELEGVGCVSLAELVLRWLAHDAGHREELAALR